MVCSGMRCRFMWRSMAFQVRDRCLGRASDHWADPHAGCALLANAVGGQRVRGRQLPASEFGRLRVLRGLSRRTLNEAHEPPIAVDHDFASHPAGTRACGGRLPRKPRLPLPSSSRHEFGCSSAPADTPRAERQPALGSMRTGRQAFLESTRAAWLCESQISSQFWGRAPTTKSVPAYSGHWIHLPPMTSALDLFHLVPRVG